MVYISRMEKLLFIITRRKMPPQGAEQESFVLYETDAKDDQDAIKHMTPQAEKRVWKIVWRNVAIFTYLHIGFLYGAYLFLTNVMWTTRLFWLVLYVCSGLGITAGAHRLWAHKSYKAKLPLRILLTFFNTLAFQDAVVDWARDHRMHHKYSETDADPHNATRGFFFSHVGWLLVRKHPQIKAKGHTIDMSDLRNDPVLRFQKKCLEIDQERPIEELKISFYMNKHTRRSVKGAQFVLPQECSIYAIINVYFSFVVVYNKFLKCHLHKNLKKFFYIFTLALYKVKVNLYKGQ